jgi:hypothetical protein
MWTKERKPPIIRKNVDKGEETTNNKEKCGKRRGNHQ